MRGFCLGLKTGISDLTKPNHKLNLTEREINESYNKTCNRHIHYAVHIISLGFTIPNIQCRSIFRNNISVAKHWHINDDEFAKTDDNGGQREWKTILRSG